MVLRYRRGCANSGVREITNAVDHVQVSCSLTEPPNTRPNEGFLRVEVDFSPMATPKFADAGSRPAQDGVEERVELQRLMEVTRTFCIT